MLKKPLECGPVRTHWKGKSKYRMDISRLQRACMLKKKKGEELPELSLQPMEELSLEPQPLQELSLEPEPLSLEPEPTLSLEPQPLSLEPEPQQLSLEPEPMLSLDPQPLSLEPEPAPLSLEPEPLPMAPLEPTPPPLQPAAPLEPTPPPLQPAVGLEPTPPSLQPAGPSLEPAPPTLQPSGPDPFLQPGPMLTPSEPTLQPAPMLGGPVLQPSGPTLEPAGPPRLELPPLPEEEEDTSGRLKLPDVPRGLEDRDRTLPEADEIAKLQEKLYSQLEDATERMQELMEAQGRLDELQGAMKEINKLKKTQHELENLQDQRLKVLKEASTGTAPVPRPGESRPKRPPGQARKVPIQQGPPTPAKGPMLTPPGVQAPPMAPAPPPPPDAAAIGKDKVLKCNNCGAMLKISIPEGKNSVNVKCPVCSTVGEFRIGSKPAPGAAPKAPAGAPAAGEEPENLIKVKCPACTKTFSVEKTPGPQKIHCPYCDTEGMMK